MPAAVQRHILNGRVITKPQTHLKYAVEVQIPRDPLRLLGLVEPVIERMVYEDLPLNLGAIKTRVEENQRHSKVAELEAQGNTQRAAALRRRLEAPSDAELQNDVVALAAELERRYHHLKRMPTRAELRADQRCVPSFRLPAFITYSRPPALRETPLFPGCSTVRCRTCSLCYCVTLYSQMGKRLSDTIQMFLQRMSIMLCMHRWRQHVGVGVCLAFVCHAQLTWISQEACDA